MHAGDVVVASTLDSGHQPALNGRISVKKSKGVHVGHRIYYNAPVNVILPDNTLTLRPEQLNSVEQNFVDHTVLADKKGKFQLNKKRAIILAVAIVTVIVIVVIAVVLTRPKYTPDDEKKIPFKLINRQQWQAINPVGDIPLLKIHPAPYVIIAHTAGRSCNETELCKKIVRDTQAYHFSLGFYDIGYNFLIGGDGAAYEGRGWDKQGAHTIIFNSRSIGIGFMGNFENEPPPSHQIKSCHFLLEEGLRLNKITQDYKIFAHKQVLNSSSPGSAFMKEIITWPHWSKYDPKIDGPKKY